VKVYDKHRNLAVGLRPVISTLSTLQLSVMSAPQNLMIGMGKAGKRSLKTVLLVVSRQSVPTKGGILLLRYFALPASCCSLLKLQVYDNINRGTTDMNKTEHTIVITHATELKPGAKYLIALDRHAISMEDTQLLLSGLKGMGIENAVAVMVNGNPNELVQVVEQSE
jgi:hypothetical protein